MQQITHIQCKSVQGGSETEHAFEATAAIMVLSICTCFIAGLVLMKWVLACPGSEKVLPF